MSHVVVDGSLIVPDAAPVKRRVPFAWSGAGDALAVRSGVVQWSSTSPSVRQFAHETHCVFVALQVRCVFHIITIVIIVIIAVVVVVVWLLFE